MRSISPGFLPICLFVGAMVCSCSQTEKQETNSEDSTSKTDEAVTAKPSALILPKEKHFTSIRQLTNGGENAEAYWSWSGDALIMQSTSREAGCDQIFILDLAENSQTLVSIEGGRTTCSYFLPGDEWVVYSSTHLASADCPPVPDMSQGYTWPVYDSYDIFKRPRTGGDLVRLTDNPAYDAEATIGPDGTIVFTSLRDGDLNIYTMDSDGKNVKQLTDELGYDGGPFFSKDGTKICFRSFHPDTPEEEADYRSLLDRNLVRPGNLEIWVMDADGSNKKRLTNNGRANFCPFFHPSGEKLIFTSNMNAEPRSRNFDLFMIDLDGENLEQVTFDESFDGFPMFSPDGKQLAFSSNRHNERRGETNVFVADWAD